MVRHPCSRSKGGSHIRTGLEHGPRKYPTDKAFCADRSGPLLRTAYVNSGVGDQALQSSYCSSCTCDVRDFGPDQISGGGHRSAALELYGLSAARRNISCLQEVGTVMNFLF